MAGYCLFILMTLCLHAGKATQDFPDHVENNHTCKHTLKEVQMFASDGRCSPEIKIHSAMSLTLPKESFSVLPNCVNCSISLVAPKGKQIVVSLYIVGTETTSDKCDLNRLDIYDGDDEYEDNRLSDADGICGCKFPSGGEFKSSNNTLTLHYQTTCQRMRIHGELELVITPVDNDLFNITDCKGDFECRNGECIDKNLVCNGDNNCRDHSDEIDCHIRNGTCPGQFECLNGSCIDKNLVCNGQKDCHDGSDEKGCHKHPTNGTCSGKFECSDGKCIDKNKVCNGKNDCKDKSDETGCHMNINRVLLYVLIALAGAFVLLLVVIMIILCCKYCCISFRMASVYRRLS